MLNKLLIGKRGIITGALNENSLAWQTALQAHEQGAQIVLTNSHHAIEKGGIQKLAEQIKSKIIPSDATNMDELENFFTKSLEVMGGKIYFVLHSIVMSTNIRKEIPCTQLD